MARMKSAVTTAFLTALLAGCATAPSQIRPRTTDYRQYLNFSCTELGAKREATEVELRRYLVSQDKARIADALTFPVPTSKVFGKNRRNVEAIARLSGELEAQKQAYAVKCLTQDGAA